MNQSNPYLRWKHSPHHSANRCTVYTNERTLQVYQANSYTLTHPFPIQKALLRCPAPSARRRPPEKKHRDEINKHGLLGWLFPHIPIICRQCRYVYLHKMQPFDVINTFDSIHSHMPYRYTYLPIASGPSRSSALDLKPYYKTVKQCFHPLVVYLVSQVGTQFGTKFSLNFYLT